MFIVAKVANVHKCLDRNQANVQDLTHTQCLDRDNMLTKQSDAKAPRDYIHVCLHICA